MLFVDYENEDFPTSVLPDFQGRLGVTWDDILWAAVTVGRPNVFHVFRHGQASVHEAIFRWSMVRMALQQRGPHGRKLVRTDLFKQMDPTEKGAVNYFLGLLTCKMFASKLLDAPWALHLDVFRPMLSPRILGGRSRPDMVAQSTKTGQWHAFECKGRASVPGNIEKQKAKAQAQRLVSVGGTTCTLHVGAITFFRNDAIEFYWRDPEPGAREPIKIPDPATVWHAYYSPFVEVIRSFAEPIGGAPEPPGLLQIAELDLSIRVHPAIALSVFKADWQRAHEEAKERSEEFASDGYQPDGLLVKAGPSWFERFEMPELR